MDPALRELLAELAEFGATTDASTDERAHRMLYITHDTGVVLSPLVRATGSGTVPEIGTSNGYSHAVAGRRRRRGRHRHDRRDARLAAVALPDRQGELVVLEEP
ncbi:hypothetical protein [Pseudonocardia endophytica]|uniref:hypothetical protein n=1 Tax=Pseudonocardia endophytica TaxID=401976 RepID=UPI00104AD816|nr:hypothetical protein [Pseudonocardia endophytica]